MVACQKEIMKEKDPLDSFSTGCGKDVKNLFSPSKIVIIYTSFKIIFQMKKILGLEAMLEYLSNYVWIVEKNNPQLKKTVEYALVSLDVERIYKDAERMINE